MAINYNRHYKYTILGNVIFIKLDILTLSMRYFLVIVLCLNFTVYGFSQVSKIDSLRKLLVVENVDSNKVTLLWRLAEQYQTFKPDTSLQLAQQALFLAQRIKFKEGESRSLAVLATSQYLLGNYPSALSNYMLKLKIEEKRNSPRNYASALSNIGLMYILLGDYSNALSYLYKADSTVESAGIKTKEEMKYSIILNMGEAYYRMNNLDSASLYFKKALILAKQSNNDIYIGESMLGEANVLASQKYNQSALEFYHPAFSYLNDGFNNDMLCEVTLGMAKVYQNLNQIDSAVFYGRTSFSIATRDGFLSRQLDASNFLSKVFKKMNRFDSAYNYIELTTVLKDSIKGREKIKEAFIISSNEELRQAELAEQRIKDKETRSQQLQLLVIAICIPLFFLLTLFISRIKIHVNVIRFMGIISLLLLFEYLTLLLHPFVAKITNHTPLLEILIFVSFASVIIPLHHKLEQMLIANLTKGKVHWVGRLFKPKTVKIKMKQ